MVQSLSFFQSVLHSGEQLINNYKALMSPFHIKLFCVYNKSFCVFLYIFPLLLCFLIFYFTYTQTLAGSEFLTLSPLIFYFCQLFILFDYQLSTQNLVSFIFFYFSLLLHISTLFFFISFFI